MYSLGVSSIRSPAAPHLAGGGVELQVAHPEQRVADLLGAPAQRLDPRQQLLEGERLGHVVVGAGAERLHLEVHRVLRGQDQDRRGGAPVAKRPQHFEAAHPGQPEIEHDEVVPAARGEAQSLHAVVHQIGVEVVFLQPALHVLADGAVVLDDEDLHAGTGRYTRKVAPRPGALSTSIRPPWSATMP